MNPRYRYFYLSVGAVGFIILFYQIISDLPQIDPIRVLCISVPDLVFFFLAYKTYPPEADVKSNAHYSHRKASNY